MEKNIIICDCSRDRKEGCDGDCLYEAGAKTQFPWVAVGLILALLLVLLMPFWASGQGAYPGHFQPTKILSTEQPLGCPPLQPSSSFTMLYKGASWYVTVDASCNEVVASSKGIVVLYRDGVLIHKICSGPIKDAITGDTIPGDYDPRIGFPTPRAIRDAYEAIKPKAAGGK